MCGLMLNIVMLWCRLVGKLGALGLGETSRERRRWRLPDWRGVGVLGPGARAS